MNRSQRKGLPARLSKYREPLARYFIASEGTKTEPQYFNELKYLVDNTIIQIISLSRVDEDDTSSDPKDILALLDKTKKRRNKLDDGNSEYWLLIDRDHRQSGIERQKMADIQQLCSQKGYEFCISTPCFELWLLLHLNPLSNYTAAEQAAFIENKKVNATRTAIEKELSDLMVALGSGYSKNKLDMGIFSPKIQDAIQNAFAEQLENGWDYDRLCTRVHVLVSHLLSF
jgi:hypothetical protein